MIFKNEVPRSMLKVKVYKKQYRNKYKNKCSEKKSTSINIIQNTAPPQFSQGFFWIDIRNTDMGSCSLYGLDVFRPSKDKTNQILNRSCRANLLIFKSVCMYGYPGLCVIYVQSAVQKPYITCLMYSMCYMLYNIFNIS